MDALSQTKPITRTILTAEFHPALEDALLEHLAGRIERYPVSAGPIVVPTNLLGLHLSRSLAARTGGHANLRFQTLKDLARSLTPTPLPGDRALLPPRADEIVVRRLLDDGIARGGYFEAIADRPGLATAILSTIRDLKEACYDPGSFAECGAQARLLKRRRDDKLAELVRIWAAYEDLLRDERWADDLDLMRAAAEAVRGSGNATHPPLVLYGFYDLNSLQRRLIKSYTDVVDTTVFFPYAEIDAFRFARPTLAWFLDIGFARDERGASEPRDWPLPQDTRLVSAPGEAREAREDIRLLARIMEERDLSFQDVAVLLRSAGTYSGLFAEELSHIHAEPYIEAPPPVSRTREGRSLLKLAHVIESGFGRAQLMDFLNVADIDLGRLTVSRDEPPLTDWNKASMLAGVVSGAESWLKRLRRLKDRIEGADPDDRFAAEHGRMAEPIESLLSLLETLLPKLADLPPRATAAEYVDHLARAFHVATGRGGPGEEALEDSQGGVALEAVRGINAVSGIAGMLDFSRFAELLRACLDAPSPREQRFGLGGPSVLNVMAARGLPFRTVIIPGLVEREFPMRRRQDPILLDHERKSLNAARGHDPLALIPLPSEGTDEEQLLFRLAVSSASEVAVLSFPRLDPAKAQPRIPSVYMLKSLEALTGKRQDFEALDTSPLVTRIPLSRRFPEDRADALTRDEFDGCSVLMGISNGDAGEIAYLVQGDRPLAGRLEMEEARWGKSFFTEYDGALTSREATAAVERLTGMSSSGPGRTLAATTLEDYAICPFRFFVRHVLGIEPIDEPQDAVELSPRDRGSLYHAVLEEFMRQMRARGRLPLRREDRRTLYATAERLAGSGRWGLADYPGARRLELLPLLRDLALWFADELGDDSGFVPSYFEARFGGRRRPHDDEKLSLETGIPFDAMAGVHVEFGGKIDRVDVSRDGKRARVIDYKTGKAPSMSRGTEKIVLDYGRRLQLPIYMLASREMLAGRHPDAVVESAEYRFVATGDRPQALAFSSELFDERTDDLKTAIGLIIRGVADGMFFPYPDDAMCRHCDFADACGSTSTALALIKRGDRRASFYTEGLAAIK